MRYRRLGRTGLEVSRLGLGTMQWGEAVDEHEAHDQLTAFLDAGGTLVDTAANYSFGASETTLGAVITKNNCRDQIVLASKAGFRSMPDGVRRDASRLSMLRQLDESLERLGTDHLDLWQVHVWDGAVPVEETLATLEHAVRTGRTRYVGISNYAGWQTAHAHTWLASRPDALTLAGTQVEYSLVNRDVETEVVPAVLAFGMGILAWSPLGRGVLTGKYRGGIPADSRGATPGLDRFVAPYLTPECASVVEAVAKAAEGLDVDISHVALAWLRDRPAVAAAIVGARTADQLRQSLASEDVDLPEEIVQALDDVSEAHR
ncbi:MAG: aldo/keto reductase [Kineosporiaceae bacterium]|nr:aldo/keto reductase [Aeromicrobium sp.]